MTREQREAMERKLDARSRAAAGLFERFRPEELLRRPSESSWSAAECLVHLNLTAAAMIPLVEVAIAELREHGRRTGSASRMDWMGKALSWALEPGRFASKTAPGFQPRGVATLSGILTEFRSWQDRLVTLLREAEGLELSSAEVRSPFDRRVRYNAYSALNILETHERRHLHQAEQAASGAALGSRSD